MKRTPSGRHVKPFNPPMHQIPKSKMESERLLKILKKWKEEDAAAIEAAFGPDGTAWSICRDNVP